MPSTARAIKPNLKRQLMRQIEAFEGGWLAGDFDGMVASWEPLQWNLGKRTLQPLLRRIHALDPVGMSECVGEECVQAIFDDEAITHFVRRRVLDPTNPKRAAREWRERFSKLSRLEAAQQAFAEHAEAYFNRAALDATRLGIVTPRGLCLLWDTAVQNGGISEARLLSYWRKMTLERAEEWQRLEVLAHCVADHARPEFREDVRRRKLTIALRKGRVHGKDYDIERDFGILYFADRNDPSLGLATWYA
jgi:hypothetical protein